jgi:rhamnosyltransferase subunit B
MRFVLASVGSLGDVHPFIAIGRALQQRGHEVLLIANDDHAAVVGDAGLRLAPTGPAVDLAAAAASPNMWHPIKGLGVFWKHMLAPAIEPTFRHIQTFAAAGPCTVVAPPVMFGARYARDALGVRLVSAYTAPAVLRTDRAPVTMAHWRLPVGTPAGLVRLAWAALDRHKLHPMAWDRLSRQADALGAPPPRVGTSLFGEWMHSPDGGITLFPDWFAPTRPGWPAGLRHGGFPLYDGDAQAPLPQALARFLDAGEPPVVCMPGSAMRHAGAFFAAAAEATAALGLRALFLTPHADQLPAPLPPHVLHLPYAPFPALLPRARALLHHGGIGSSAQALRAGIPQVLMPMAHDQFDNAACLHRLGVGRTLRPRHFTAARLRSTLAAALATPPDRLRACRDRLAASPLPALCALLETAAGA